MRLIVLGVLLAALMLSGCTFFGQQQNLTNNTTAPPPPPPPPKPASFSITSPTADQVFTISGDTTDITLSLTTQNLILKQPSGAAKKGEGNFRVTVDGGTPQTVTTKTYTISGLGVGNHTIKVELMNNDKTPYSGVSEKDVSFSIEKEKPKEYVPQSYNVSIEPGAKVGTEDFNPANLTVKIGDSVTWTNNGNVPQSATCSQAGKIVFDTKTLGPGTSATITFSDLLECDYYSTLFRAMTGHISVVSNGTG